VKRAGAGKPGLIRIVVVDDEPMVCAHLRTVLSVAEDIEVVDEAHDGAAGVEAVVRHRPDVVLMDLRMPGVDGLTALERIRTLDQRPRVVVLTTFDTDDYILRALRGGAVCFLLKSTPPEDLVEVVRVAADGHTVISPAATRRLLALADKRQADRDHRLALIDQLTEREAEVLACLGEGMSNAQIAKRVHLSEPTVKSYVSRILVRLECTNRTQAGLLAFDVGLTDRRPGSTGHR
jgi:DNA-binding NarL/FixJ family response regulator